ncbi:MAG: glycine cleavage system protein H [Burkholderiales bacterium]|nr:glycine cleavage system protein H [Burkholderiales bacterium]
MAEYQGCELPEDLYYDLDYVWVRPEPDGTYTVGLTDPSQTMAGRVQHCTIRAVGTHRARKKPLARLESGKWAGGIPAPFAGTIVARNERLIAEPGLVNVSPYTDAWVVRLRADEPARALDDLVTGAAAIAGLRAWIDRYNVQCMRCSQ